MQQAASWRRSRGEHRSQMCRSVQLSSSKIGVQLGRCMPDPAPGTTVQDEGGQVLVAVARGARDRGRGGRSLPPPTPPKQPVRPSRPKDQSLAMASPFPHPRQRPAHRCSRNEEVPPFYKLVAACRSPLKRVCNPRGQGAMKLGGAPEVPTIKSTGELASTTPWAATVGPTRELFPCPGRRPGKAPAPHRDPGQKVFQGGDAGVWATVRDMAVCIPDLPKKRGVLPRYVGLLQYEHVQGGRVTEPDVPNKKSTPVEATKGREAPVHKKSWEATRDASPR